MVHLTQHFATKDLSHADQQRRWFIKARHDAKLRADSVDKLNDDILATAAEAVMAAEIQIEAFRAKLDTYDAATTAALMENQVTLDDIERRLMEVEEQLESFWIHANLMDDGRRVFLNADRTQAFDEFGQEVSNDDYDYDLFPEGHFAVDPILDQLKQRGELHQSRADALEVRQRIHEFDDLKNQTRDRLDSGEIAEEELEELDADLLEAMPPSVAKQISGVENALSVPSASSSFTAKANPAALQAAPSVKAAFQPETL